MQGPVVDLVMLTLLLLFFGMHQRSRPELFYRFWFTGWIAVYLAYAVWEVPLQSGALSAVQDLARYCLTVFGLTMFALSPTITPESVRRTLRASVPVLVSIFVVLNVTTLTGADHGEHIRWVVAGLVVVTELLGLRLVVVVLPRGWRVRRSLLFVLAATMTPMLVRAALAGSFGQVPEVLEMETAFAAALMYAAAYAEDRSLSGVLGSLGFASWGLFYWLSDLLEPMPKGQRIVYALWSIPKYMVGFSMIMQIFEASRREAQGLATQYRMLYEDFRRMFQRHPHPMWIYGEQGGKLLRANAAALRTYGYSEAELRGMVIGELEATQASDATTIKERKDTERRYRRKDGSLLWVDVSDHAVQFQGQAARLRMARDVTERRRETDELFYRANHDALTGLPNRALLRDRVEQCLLRSARDRRMAAMFAIDVDHFKQVNDTYGHPVGDQCLQMVAKRLQGRVRQVDTLARTGGEEFTAIVGGLHGPEDAEKIGTLLLELFETPIRLPECDLPITVSLGVALYPQDGETAESLERTADEALYEAKRAGRNCMRMYGAVEAPTVGTR